MNPVFITSIAAKKPVSPREADEYVVEEILEHNLDGNNTTHYQSKWYGFEEPDWQFAVNIAGGLRAIYHSQM